MAEVSATKLGFALEPHCASEVVALAPPVEEQHAAVLAFLADGEFWSSLVVGSEHRPPHHFRTLCTAAKKPTQFEGEAAWREFFGGPSPVLKCNAGGELALKLRRGGCAMKQFSLTISVPSKANGD